MFAFGAQHPWAKCDKAEAQLAVEEARKAGDGSGSGQSDGASGSGDGGGGACEDVRVEGGKSEAAATQGAVVGSEEGGLVAVANEMMRNFVWFAKHPRNNENVVAIQQGKG